MLLDLAMESSVNEGNTRAQHYIVKILYVAKLCNSNYNIRRAQVKVGLRLERRYSQR